MITEPIDNKDPIRETICPFCGSPNNELFSLFGQTLIGSQYYCNNCHTIFEAVRWDSAETPNIPKALNEENDNGV